MTAESRPRWAQDPIKNILIDINGVLFDSGEDHPIEGSVEAMHKLVRQGFNLGLVTNECTLPKRKLLDKLHAYGFTMLKPDQILSPAPTACKYLLKENLTPRMHVYKEVLPDFQPVLGKMDPSSKPDCIVIGDIMDQVSRDFMDESLEVMLKADKTPQIISLGGGRYYKDGGRIRMDTGAYAAAFSYALGIDNILCIGKPSKFYFREAITMLGGTYKDTIMIGDDLVSDVRGAATVGMRGFLVRTGKGSLVQPGLVPVSFANLLQFTDELIFYLSKSNEIGPSARPIASNKEARPTVATQTPTTRSRSSTRRDAKTQAQEVAAAKELEAKELLAPWPLATEDKKSPFEPESKSKKVTEQELLPLPPGFAK